MWYPSAARPSRIGMISGWSQTAVAIRPGPVRQRPRLARDLEDRRRRILLDRRHRVGRPAEPAHLGAARARSRSGACRRARCAASGSSCAGPRSRERCPCATSAAGRRPCAFSADSARAPVDRRDEEARQRGRRREEPVAVEARHRGAPRSAARGARRRPARRRRRRARAPPGSSARCRRRRGGAGAARRGPRAAPGSRPSGACAGCGRCPSPRRATTPAVRTRKAACPVSKVTAGSSLLVEEALADDVRDPVEEPVHPLEAEVRHPDLVGVREPEGQPVGAEAVRLLGEALEGGALAVDGGGRHAKLRIIGASARRAGRGRRGRHRP